MNDKRYENLLAGLAQFLTECADPYTLQEFTDPDNQAADNWITAAGLDEFLSGYAGQDWSEAKATAESIL